MKIYVDFDDCLCETGRFLADFAYELFGKRVPYEEMRYFNLQKSFDLTDEQYQELLEKAHEPEKLLSYEETPGASETVRAWIRGGYQVSVITGRPCAAYEVSRLWLDRHNLPDVKLYCLDKYGRENQLNQSEFNLIPEDFYRMNFDFAVEDSPLAFRFFDPLPELKVMVFDRPWNRNCTFPNDKYRRCYDWTEIKASVR